jgi:hypothetical protein
MDIYYIFFSLAFSMVGMGYFVYGKKTNPYFMIAGIILMVYPYFVYTLLWLMIFGLALMILPFLLDRILPF